MLITTLRIRNALERRRLGQCRADLRLRLLDERGLLTLIVGGLVVRRVACVHPAGAGLQIKINAASGQYKPQ